MNVSEAISSGLSVLGRGPSLSLCFKAKHDFDENASLIILENKTLHDADGHYVSDTFGICLTVFVVLLIFDGLYANVLRC